MPSPSATSNPIENSRGLERRLTQRQLTMMTIVGAIGVGLFLGSSVTIRLAGPSVILSYIFSGIIAVIVAYSIAEMAVIHPGRWVLRGLCTDLPQRVVRFRGPDYLCLRSNHCPRRGGYGGCNLLFHRVPCDLRSTKQSILESLDIARQINNKSHVALALTTWGEILMAEGDLAQARKNLEEALRIRTEIEQKSNAVGTRLQLATLAIEEGHAADAENTAREVRDEYRKEEHPDDEIGAYVVLLRTLHAESKSDEAQKEVGEAKLLQEKSQNIYNRLAMRIVDAQIEAATGKRDEALRNLSIATHDAVKDGLLADQLEARLAHAEIELHAGQTLTGRAELAAVRKDAAARGFGLIGQNAKALMTE